MSTNVSGNTPATCHTGSNNQKKSGCASTARVEGDLDVSSRVAWCSRTTTPAMQTMSGAISDRLEIYPELLCFQDTGVGGGGGYPICLKVSRTNAIPPSNTLRSRCANATRRTERAVARRHCAANPGVTSTPRTALRSIAPGAPSTRINRRHRTTRPSLPRRFIA
jgi:hypothetical protein